MSKKVYDAVTGTYDENYVYIHYKTFTDSTFTPNGFTDAIFNVALQKYFDVDTCTEIVKKMHAMWDYHVVSIPVIKQELTDVGTLYNAFNAYKEFNYALMYHADEYKQLINYYNEKILTIDDLIKTTTNISRSTTRDTTSKENNSDVIKDDGNSSSTIDTTDEAMTLNNQLPNKKIEESNYFANPTSASKTNDNNNVTNKNTNANTRNVDQTRDGSVNDVSKGTNDINVYNYENMLKQRSALMNSVRDLVTDYCKTFKDCFFHMYDIKTDD